MSLDRLTSILPPQFFEGAPQDVADDEQQPAVEVRLGESAANKPSASSSAYDDEDFDMFSANEEDASSSVTSSSYGWMNNMKSKKYGGSYAVAFLFFLVFVMVISMASVGITVHRQNKSVMMTSNAAIIEDCETKAPTPKRVRALASSPDAAADAAASTQGGEKNGREGIEQRRLKGDQVKRGLGVPSPTPVKGDAVVPSPTPVERVLGVPSRRLQGCTGGSLGSGELCGNTDQSKCNNPAQSTCVGCVAQPCPGTSPTVYICGPSGVSLEKCPSEKPSSQPSEAPSESTQPSSQPSESPSESTQPSSQPSVSPSVSTQPSSQPSVSPSVSTQPSSQPSESPSESKQPSDAPSELPSVSLQPSVSSAPSTVSYFSTL
jgi:hypothetical protein